MMLKNPMIVNYLLLGINIVMLSTGQILFKFGLNKIGTITLANSWKAIFSPTIFLGLVLYVIATLIWFVVLTRMPLSVAYPAQSFAYVLGIIAALFIFNEPISLVKWIGAAVIMIGVFLIAVD